MKFSFCFFDEVDDEKKYLGWFVDGRFAGRMCFGRETR
jgi:hypothetical protein